MFQVNEKQNIAIQVSEISKEYRLGQIGSGTLQGDLQRWWARCRGKEDPNVKIGVAERTQLNGQKFMALDRVNLTVYKGDTLGIIGDNGAGKSTLLKLLSRITVPTNGRIDLYGRVSGVLEIGAGFNGQLTGRENIYMNGAILGMSKSEIAEKLNDIVEFSEVGDFIDTPVKRYSSGMFVKLAFAVAAHLSSEIMIMDEVLAVGDISFRKKCISAMREAAEVQGRTILYVSHNLETIRELCNRCIVMEAGRIIFDGNTEQAIALYLERGSDHSQVNMDLTGRLHSARSRNSPLKMENLQLEGKNAAIYNYRETMILRFQVSLTVPLKGVKLRVTFRTVDDQAIGTSWSESIDLAVGRSCVRFYIPLVITAAGDFYTSVGFYYTNERGKLTQLDHISRLFRFEMEQLPEIKFWQTPAYGFVNLPQIKGELL